ncbi:MAG TPA: hypothetical protein VH915_06575 [Pedococcus sp.]|jgi:hypothetical protein
MPPPVDPERLLALGTAVAALRETARDGADEALALFPELGEREVQSAVDGLLEQLADTLRALDAEASELTGRLHIAGQSAPQAGPGRDAGSRAGSGTRREWRS